MPIYNGIDMSWEELADLAYHISHSSCDICNEEFHRGMLLRNPATGFLMKVCFGCFCDLPYLTTSDDCVEHLEKAYCSRCGEMIPISVLSYNVNNVSTALCPSCSHNNNIWECFSCHNTFRNNVHQLWVFDGDEEYPICPTCAESEGDFILPYQFNPKFEYYKTDKDKRELLYFGIELEIESCGNNKKEAVKSLPKFVYPKCDSSINDGFEIVSHPMTYNWLKDNCDKWNKILDLRKKGWRSYNTETCGMHIHLSEAAFGTYHLFKFMKMFYDNTDFIIRFSQRKAHNLQHWASTTDHERNIIYKAKHKNMYSGENRHTAINLSRENTVEVRIFRGTLCPPSFWKNILKYKLCSQ